MTTAHVVPDDLVEHTEEACVCGPTMEAVTHENGRVDWIAIHHALGAAS